MKKLILTIFFLELICISYAENVKKSVDNMRSDNGDDNGDNDESKDVAMEIPDIDISDNRTQLCSARRQNHNMHTIINATAKQFPFMAALMSLNEEHVCSGTVLSNGLILTTASCVDKQVNSVMLNTIKAKDSKDSVRLAVIRAEKFPSYNGEESLNNVAIVYTLKHNASVASRIRVSNYTSAQNLIDMEALGFGLNEYPGQTKALQYVGVENRFQTQPGNVLHVYLDCVESKVPVCFADYGGPAIFGNELVGIVVKGNNDCIKEMSANYAINKEMATVLPTYTFKHWLDDKIKKHDDQNTVAIMTYPSKLVAVIPTAPAVSVQANSAAGVAASIFAIFLACMFSLFFH